MISFPVWQKNAFELLIYGTFVSSFPLIFAREILSPKNEVSGFRIKCRSEIKCICLFCCVVMLNKS